MILMLPLRAQAQIKLRLHTRRRPREVERAGVEKLPHLGDAVLVRRFVAQRDKVRGGDAEHLGAADLADGRAARHHDKVEHRLLIWEDRNHA